MKNDNWEKVAFIASAGVTALLGGVVTAIYSMKRKRRKDEEQNSLEKDSMVSTSGSESRYSSRANIHNEDRYHNHILTWIRNAYEKRNVLSVKITEKNRGGYMVRFVVDSAEEGFMPNSCSGYRAWEIGETVDVVVINLTDKPIVSAQAAILAKEEDVYQKKVRLLSDAKSLLEREDVASAIKSYWELRTKWDEIGHAKRENELWPEFKGVIDQLYLKNEKLRQLAKELKELEVEKKQHIISQFEPGDKVYGTVVKILPRDSGILVKLEGQCVEIMGIVPKKEISYNYFSNIEDVVNIGKIIEVVVLEVNKEEQKLTLGMKQLEQYYANETFSSEEHEFDQETVYDVKIKKIKYPGLIITEAFDKYSCGIISPNNILLNDTPMSASARWMLMRELYQEGEYIKRVQFVGYSEDNNVAFLQVSLPGNMDVDAESVELGDISDVEVKDINNDYILVGPRDNRLAYINSSEFRGKNIEYGAKLRARLVDVGDNVLQYSRYSTLDLDEEYDSVKSAISEDSRLSEIFESEELTELRQDPQKLECLKQVLDEYPDLVHEKNRKELTMEFRIKATQDSELYRGRFFECHNDEYFNNKSLKVYYDDNNEKLYLWDVYERLVIVCESGGSLYLEKIFDDNQNNTAHNIIKNKRLTKLLINGSLLKIFPYLSTEQLSAKKNLDKISAIQFVNKLKYDLHKQVKKEIGGKTELYTNSISFLEWQIEQEKNKVGDAVYVAPDAILRRDASTTGSLALQADISYSQIEQLVNDEYAVDISNEEAMRFAIMKKEDSDRFVSAKLVNVNGERWRLEFSKDVTSLDWIKNGFFIKYKPSVRHLKEQKDAIENYIRKDSLDMLTDIIYSNLKDIDISLYDDIQFFNPIFKAATEDNHQVEAVKKALAAEKIVLIQGPPGTGKTTVIVEIIRQLVQRQNKRVLVCCQAHSAVDNIYDRLENIGRENPQEALQLIRVKNEGEMQTNEQEKNASMFQEFLNQQLHLLKSLEVNNGDVNSQNIIDTSAYKSETRLVKAHQDLVQKFKMLSGINSSVLVDAFEELGKDADFHRFYNNEDCSFRNADVVLGTCIGVGVTRGIDGKMFDVVIIDEAAKANIGESIVPMSLGTKYILVGDDQQLPPYVDVSEIKKYLKSVSEKQTDEDEGLACQKIIEYQKKSLFEDIHHNIPDSCVVTLNYQHRMNPQIGDCISELFYFGNIQNGPYTHERTIESHLFPENVVFIDTSEYHLSKSPKYEERCVGGSLCNYKEKDVICDYIVPHISKLIGTKDPSDFLGIVSPYAAQVDLLKQNLPEQFVNCVHTVDSIQGSEYDIVVFSFVRSVSKKEAKKLWVNVGFVADMRRLNVSLSRARCKLIMVGDLQTLTNVDAYSHISDEVVGENHPITVFQKMSRYKKTIEKRSALDILVDKLRTEFKPGYVLKNCRITDDESDSNIRKFTYIFNNEEIELHGYCPNVTNGQYVDIVYKGNNKNSRPQFIIKEEWPKDQFINKLRTEFRPGYVLKNCRITDDESNSNIRKFTYVFNNEEIELPGFCPNVKIGQNVTMMYTGDNKYNIPQFKIKIEWTETEIETIRSWQREKKILTGKIVYIGKRTVRIQAAGITGTAPLRFFNSQIAKGVIYSVQVYEFDSDKGVLKFKLPNNGKRY